MREGNRRDVCEQEAVSMGEDKENSRGADYKKEREEREKNIKYKGGEALFLV